MSPFGKALFLFAFLSGVIFHEASPLVKQWINNYKIEWRVNGGSDALPNEFPYMAMLVETGGFFFCGGSLINNRYVLTAAHCLEKRAADMINVRLGEHDWSQPGKDVVVIRADKVFIHPKFSTATTFNDVGLVKLKNDVAFTNAIKPICLPKPSTITLDGTAVVSGWGAEHVAGAPLKKLQKLELDVLSNGKCAEMLRGYSIYLTEDKVCGWKPNKDACKGDSGGPLATIDKKTQIGIVNMGFRCGATNLPGLYMRVNKYLSWIQGYIKDAESSTCYN